MQFYTVPNEALKLVTQYTVLIEILLVEKTFDMLCFLDEVCIKHNICPLMSIPLAK
jgi:hypothetical protein